MDTECGWDKIGAGGEAVACDELDGYSGRGKVLWGWKEVLRSEAACGSEGGGVVVDGIEGRRGLPGGGEEGREVARAGKRERGGEEMGWVRGGMGCVGGAGCEGGRLGCRVGLECQASEEMGGADQGLVAR